MVHDLHDNHQASSNVEKVARSTVGLTEWRIVWQHLVYRRPPSEIAQLMCVSERSVWRYISLFERTGDVKPANYHHGPCMLLGDFEQLTLLRLILQCPGIMLHELQDKFVRRFGVRVSMSTFCRTLKYMGCSRQVIRHVATQRSDSLRAKFMAEVCKYDPSMFVWTDESGFNKRNSARKFGYGLRGIPPVDHRILVRGVRYSAIPVVSTEGVHDVFIAEATMNGNRFKQFVCSQFCYPSINFAGLDPSPLLLGRLVTGGERAETIAVAASVRAWVAVFFFCTGALPALTNIDVDGGLSTLECVSPANISAQIRSCIEVKLLPCLSLSSFRESQN